MEDFSSFDGTRAGTNSHSPSNLTPSRLSITREDVGSEDQNRYSSLVSDKTRNDSVSVASDTTFGQHTLLRHELNQKDLEIYMLNTRLSWHEKILTERDQLISKKNDELEDLKMRIQMDGKALHTQEQQLAGERSKIQTLTTQKNHLKALNEDLRQRNQEDRETIRKLQKNVEHLEEHGRRQSQSGGGSEVMESMTRMFMELKSELSSSKVEGMMSTEMRNEFLITQETQNQRIEKLVTENVELNMQLKNASSRMEEFMQTKQDLLSEKDTLQRYNEVLLKEIQNRNNLENILKEQLNLFQKKIQQHVNCNNTNSEFEINQALEKIYQSNLQIETGIKKNQSSHMIQNEFLKVNEGVNLILNGMTDNEKLMKNIQNIKTNFSEERKTTENHWRAVVEQLPMLSSLHLELQKNDGINQSLLNEILNTLMNKLNLLENGIQKNNLKESEGGLLSSSQKNNNNHNNNKEILDIVESKMQFQMNLLNQNIENSITQNQQKVDSIKEFLKMQVEFTNQEEMNKIKEFLSQNATANHMNTLQEGIQKLNNNFLHYCEILNEPFSEMKSRLEDIDLKIQAGNNVAVNVIDQYRRESIDLPRSSGANDSFRGMEETKTLMNNICEHLIELKDSNRSNFSTISQRQESSRQLLSENLKVSRNSSFELVQEIQNALNQFQINVFQAQNNEFSGNMAQQMSNFLQQIQNEVKVKESTLDTNLIKYFDAKINDLQNSLDSFKKMDSGREPFGERNDHNRDSMESSSANGFYKATHNYPMNDNFSTNEIINSLEGGDVNKKENSHSLSHKIQAMDIIVKEFREIMNDMNSLFTQSKQSLPKIEHANQDILESISNIDKQVKEVKTISQTWSGGAYGTSMYDRELPDNLVQEFKNVKLHVENQFLPISQFLFDSNTDTHQNLENMIMAWCKYILETLQTQMPNYDQVEKLIDSQAADNIIEAIQQQNNDTDFAGLTKQISILHGNLGSFHTDVDTLHTDVSTIRGEAEQFQGNVQNLKEEIDEMKTLKFETGKAIVEIINKVGQHLGFQKWFIWICFGISVLLPVMLTRSGSSSFIFSKVST